MTAGTVPGRRETADLAVVAALCGLDLLLSFDRTAQGARSLAVTALYAAAGYLALVGRRRWPGPVFGLALGHSLLGQVVSPGYQPTLGLWLALYTLALRCGRRATALGGVAMAGPLVLNVMDEVRRHDGATRAAAVTSTVVLWTGITVAIVGVGRWVRWSVHQRRLVAEHAAAAAVVAERTRIARDLHDVVAHSVTLMILQARGAARLLRSDPARAEAVLAQVDATGQQAVVELRRFLHLLAEEPPEQRLPVAEPATFGRPVPGPVRPDASGAPASSRPERTSPAVSPRGSDPSPQRRPDEPTWPPSLPMGTALPPGLQDITDLVVRARAANLDVELTTSGAAGQLDPGVDLTAYRVVQEALTNAARYADRQHPVRVVVDWQQHDVRIEVSNHARRPRGRVPSTGHGVLGMRERVRNCRGGISVGPRPDGRFVVDVTLPVVVPAPAAPSPCPQ